MLAWFIGTMSIEEFCRGYRWKLSIPFTSWYLIVRVFQGITFQLFQTVPAKERGELK